MGAPAAWRALAGRTLGLIESVQMWQAAGSYASNGMQAKFLFDQVRSLVGEIDRFATTPALPTGVPDALKDDRLRQIATPTSHGTMTDAMVTEAALRLRTILTNVEYYLADQDEMLRAVN